jgi:hypothetical protein
MKKKIIASLVTVAALAAPAGWGASMASADNSGPHGDTPSNCHTGSKFRGAGGNDKIPPKCAVAPTPAPTPGVPAGPGAATVTPGAVTVTPGAATPATPVGAAPRLTG